MRRAFSTVEVLIAIVAFVGLLGAGLSFWVNSAWHVASGGQNLSNLQEAGRILSALRVDLDEAVNLAPPFNKDGLDSLELTLIDEAAGPGGAQAVVWAYDAAARSVTRTAGADRREYGRGRVARFALRATLFPAVDRIADAQKACVEVALELLHMGPTAGSADARNFQLAHVIAPFNLNLCLQSKVRF